MIARFPYLPCIALLFALFSFRPVLAQEQFAGKRVDAVTYDPVRQPIDARDLDAMQLVKPGEPLNLNQVATTIDHLWSSGLYDDVQVDAEPSGAGVSIRFITRARQFVGHVGLRGKVSNPPSRGVLISDAQLFLGTPYDPADVEKAKQDMLQVMRENGLYESRVDSESIVDPVTHQVTIRFLVNAGKRARYDTPTITGNPNLSTGTIIRATGWRIPLIHRWRQVTSTLTEKGVDGIASKYAKQNRLTAQIDITQYGYDPDARRLSPVINIQPGPKIDIEAKEAKLKSKEIRKLVPVYEEGSVDNDLLNEGRENIHDYFQSRGYPDVDVTFSRKPVQNDKEEIDYLIALGPRRRLAAVNIEGGGYFTEQTLRERMFLQPHSLLLKYGRYSENYREQDEKAIESLYQANGFRNAKVTSNVQTDYKGKEKDIGVTFRIRPGTQIKVAKLQIIGASQLDLNPIRNQLYSIEGQPYADVNVSSDRNRILEYYFEHGFLHAAFQYKYVDGAEPGTVNLTYYITEGRQEFVRGVVLSGLDRTRPELVQKIVKMKNGEPVSMAKVNNINRELTDLGVFASVNSALQDANGDNRYKYVLFDFDEAGRYSFSAGAGLEAATIGRPTNDLSNSAGHLSISPIVSFGVNRLNFLGRGQTISLQTRYSTIDQRESLNYIVPRFLGSLNRTVQFSLLYDTTQDVQTFSSRREQASISTSQRFNRASTLSIRFDYRRVEVSQVAIPSLLIPTLLQPVRIGMFSTSYVQDHRDNPADAHRGFWNTVDAGIASGALGSQRSFVRALVRNATYTQLGHNMVLARQTQIGAIVPISVPAGTTIFNAIPLPERFFGGGSVSMRGFGDNQAGPRDIGTDPQTNATGFPIGGNALFFNNVELRFPLLGANISGVLFEDMGNIYDRFGDISLAYRQPSNTNFNYAVQAPGFGIRYKTPLGPVRVDLSYSLNPPSYYGFSNSLTTQDLLQCGVPGHNTCTTSPQRLSHINFFFSIGQMF